MRPCFLQSVSRCWQRSMDDCIYCSQWNGITDADQRSITHLASASAFLTFHACVRLSTCNATTRLWPLDRPCAISNNSWPDWLDSSSEISRMLNCWSHLELGSIIAVGCDDVLDILGITPESKRTARWRFWAIRKASVARSYCGRSLKECSVTY